MPLCNCVWLHKTSKSNLDKRWKTFANFSHLCKTCETKRRTPIASMQFVRVGGGSWTGPVGPASAVTPWHRKKHLFCWRLCVLFCCFANFCKCFSCFSQSLKLSQNWKVLKSSLFFIGETSQRRRSLVSPFWLDQKNAPQTTWKSMKWFRNLGM